MAGILRFALWSSPDVRRETCAASTEAADDRSWTVDELILGPASSKKVLNVNARQIAEPCQIILEQRRVRLMPPMANPCARVKHVDIIRARHASVHDAGKVVLVD
jgi:hypothetical protein